MSDLTPDPAYMEELASQEHEQWSGWMRYMLGEIEKEADQSLIHALNELPCMQRWRGQMVTSYEDLPERHKESDRKEVRLKMPLYRRSAEVVE